MPVHYLNTRYMSFSKYFLFLLFSMLCPRCSTLLCIVAVLGNPGRAGVGILLPVKWRLNLGKYPTVVQRKYIPFYIAAVHASASQNSCKRRKETVWPHTREMPLKLFGGRGEMQGKTGMQHFSFPLPWWYQNQTTKWSEPIGTFFI